MAKILAIDPGNEYSAYVVYCDGHISDFGIEENSELIYKVNGHFNSFDTCKHMAIEMIACYGMPVGATVFETCVWIGRFIEAWGDEFTKVYRKETKMHLCQTMRAKDSNIRQAIIDRYPATGGGKKPQIGTKAQPGPLYGVSKDVWAALAVAITFAETYSELNKP
jgi:hypothetical protein